MLLTTLVMRIIDSPSVLLLVYSVRVSRVGVRQRERTPTKPLNV